jgi:hypothetical protein
LIHEIFSKPIKKYYSPSPKTKEVSPFLFLGGGGGNIGLKFDMNLKDNHFFKQK